MLSKSSTVYIAGPMTGLPDANRAAFGQAERLLQSVYGCRVLNPANQPDGLPYCRYMIHALTMLDQADSILLLSGFPRSLGASFELAAAQRDNKDVYFLTSNAGIVALDIRCLLNPPNPEKEF